VKSPILQFVSGGFPAAIAGMERTAGDCPGDHCFPIALILAWALELTPDGIRVDVDEQKKAPALPAESVAKEKEDGFRSIAVLPFVNLSNDPDNEYFSDGMSEELLSLLCKLPQLTVASRTSSFSFKGKKRCRSTGAQPESGPAALDPEAGINPGYGRL
jgi:hypothetical protein